VKDTFWFPHDSDASSDPKIQALILHYGMAGYGMYWVIVEMLRAQAEHALPKKQYIWSAIARATLTTPDAAQEFVSLCINEWELFSEDDEAFWSESLCRRMEKWREKKVKLAEAGHRGGLARVKQNSSQAQATLKPGLSHPQARLKPGLSKSKLEENSIEEYRREEEEKRESAPNLPMNHARYHRLCDEYGEPVVADYLAKIQLWEAAKGETTKDYAARAEQWMQRDNVAKLHKPKICPDCHKQYIGDCCGRCGYEEGKAS
jgi:hypothetical protein